VSLALVGQRSRPACLRLVFHPDSLILSLSLLLFSFRTCNERVTHVLLLRVACAVANFTVPGRAGVDLLPRAYACVSAMLATRPSLPACRRALSCCTSRAPRLFKEPLPSSCLSALCALNRLIDCAPSGSFRVLALPVFRSSFVQNCRGESCGLAQKQWRAAPVKPPTTSEEWAFQAVGG